MRQTIDLIAEMADAITNYIRPTAGASVQININNSGVSGGAASVYQDASSGVVLPQPLTTDQSGRIPGWLEAGSYLITITSGSQTFTQAYNVAGVPGPVGPLGPAGPPGVGANWRGVWSGGTTYALADGVYGSNGIPYISNINGNLSNDPTTDNGTNWGRVVDPANMPFQLVDSLVGNPRAVTDWGPILNTAIAGGSSFFQFGPYVYPFQTKINMPARGVFQGISSGGWEAMAVTILQWNGTGSGAAIDLNGVASPDFRYMGFTYTSESYTGDYFACLTTAAAGFMFNHCVAGDFNHPTAPQTAIYTMNSWFSLGSCVVSWFVDSQIGPFSRYGIVYTRNATECRIHRCVTNSIFGQSFLRNPPAKTIITDMVVEATGSTDIHGATKFPSPWFIDTDANFSTGYNVLDISISRCSFWDYNSHTLSGFAGGMINADLNPANSSTNIYMEHNTALAGGAAYGAPIIKLTNGNRNRLTMIANTLNSMTPSTQPDIDCNNVSNTVLVLLGNTLSDNANPRIVNWPTPAEGSLVLGNQPGNANRGNIPNIITGVARERVALTAFPLLVARSWTTTINGAGQSFPRSSAIVASTANLPTSGVVSIAGVTGNVTYTGITPTTLTGCTGGTGTPSSGATVTLVSSPAQSNIPNYVSLYGDDTAGVITVQTTGTVAGPGLLVDVVPALPVPITGYANYPFTHTAEGPIVQITPYDNYGDPNLGSNSSGAAGTACGPYVRMYSNAGTPNYAIWSLGITTAIPINTIVSFAYRVITL